MLDRTKVYKRAIGTYGKTLQIAVCCEECSELIKELIKDVRGKSTKTQILTELADVQIMIEQMMLIYEISQKDLEEEMNFKIVRLNDRLNEGETNESGCKPFQKQVG